MDQENNYRHDDYDSNSSQSDSRLSLTGLHAVVLGMARQGKSLAHWLPTQGTRVTLSDHKNAGDLADDLMEFIANDQVSFALGGHPVELLDNADLLCISGGVSLDLPIVRAAYERGIRVTNDAVLFLERCPAPVIGVTGSAGKTTTTTLVGEMIKQEGRTAWVGGNIGNVLLDDLADIKTDDLVVMELSSFQLEILDTSPPIAALLNITPNHLDRHGTIENYARAKSQIFLHQNPNDILVYGRDDLLASTYSDEALGRKASFSVSRLVADGACMVGSRLMLMGNCSPTGMAKVICNQEDVKLRGMHNLSNVLAACALAGAAGVNVEAMREAIVNFAGVPHRLEVVATFGGITWINDSIATSPERVVAALRSFTEPIILIAGGRDKNLPWEEMARVTVERCKALVCFGEFGPMIADHVRHARNRVVGEQIKTIIVSESLEEAVESAAEIADEGDVVLLSPGGTSFDYYKDFDARGAHFRRLVKRLQDSRDTK